jgi:hypothetical protein
MTKANEPTPASALPEDAILIPTEDMSEDQIDEVADEMAAALFSKIDAWRAKHGLPPLAD